MSPAGPSTPSLMAPTGWAGWLVLIGSGWITSRPRSPAWAPPVGGSASSPWTAGATAPAAAGCRSGAALATIGRPSDTPSASKVAQNKACLIENRKLAGAYRGCDTNKAPRCYL